MIKEDIIMFTHHSDPDHHHQSDSVKHFKSKFENRMKQFKEIAETHANEAGYSGGWRDALAGTGVSVATLGFGAAITLLGIAGALTAAATAGAGLAVAVAGIAAAEGYNIYRTKQKKREYKRVVDLLHHDDFDTQLTAITNKLCDLYHFQLENCSPTDAEHLADACFKALKNQMMSNKHIKFHDLQLPSHLQALIVAGASHARKEPVNIDGRDDEKANSRGAISHAALYCQEDDQFYRCEASKPAKYGVLFFATHHELEDYKQQIAKVKCDKDRWQYEEMPPAQVKLLIRNELLDSHVNEDSYRSLEEDSDEVSTEERSLRV